jgi:hypothetical protein
MLTELKQQTYSSDIQKYDLCICFLLIHPIGPPLLEIEGDDHPPKPLLLTREGVWECPPVKSGDPVKGWDKAVLTL